MKKFVAVLLLAVVCFSYVGCGGPKTAISAEDYSARLAGMLEDMDAEELSEISTMIIGCNKSEFEELSGWHADKDMIDRDIIVWNTLLGGRSTEIELLLDGNNVSEVSYTYEDAKFVDFVGYIEFNILIGSKSPITVTEIDAENNYTFVEISEDDLTKRLAAFSAGGEDISFSCEWKYTNGNDTEANIGFNYSGQNNNLIGQFFYVVINYSL